MYKQHFLGRRNACVWVSNHHALRNIKRRKRYQNANFTFFEFLNENKILKGNYDNVIIVIIIIIATNKGWILFLYHQYMFTGFEKWLWWKYCIVSCVLHIWEKNEMFLSIQDYEGQDMQAPCWKQLWEDVLYHSVKWRQMKNSWIEN